MGTAVGQVARIRPEIPCFEYSCQGLSPDRAVRFVEDLERFTFESPPVKGRGTPTCELLTDLIVGDSDNRFGPKPQAGDVANLRRKVSSHVRCQRPIELHVMWGGVKHYVADEDQGIDLAEVFAVGQLTRLARCIARYYAPGAVVTFILEDFGVLYEDAGDRAQEERLRIEQNIDAYLGELEELIRVGSGDCARIVRVTELASSVEQLRDWARQADRNLELLQAYWRDSDGLSEESAIQLPSFHALRAEGWAGPIPGLMRRHYLTRLSCLYPHASTEERINRILRYLSIVLLYQQIDLAARVGRNSVKVSLFKPAPGIPEERIRGRIHLRLLPRSVCATVMPPWTCKGCFVSDSEAALSIKSFRLAYRDRSRFRRGLLRVYGDTGCAAIRADVLLPETASGGEEVRLQQYPPLRI